MKTINEKNISKKEIQNVLRTMEPTKIFALHHRMFGNVNRSEVYRFIREFAPTNKVRTNAYNLAHSNKHAEYRLMVERTCIHRHGFFTGDLRKYTVDALKEECTRERDNYSKFPMLGHTHLYFCSPVYGHSDYNKRRMIEIKGNERFCDLVIRYANKHF